jgi:hypothetical protein
MATGKEADYLPIKCLKLQNTVQTDEKKPSIKELYSFRESVIRTPVHLGDSKDFNRKIKSQLVKEKAEVSTVHYAPVC